MSMSVACSGGSSRETRIALSAPALQDVADDAVPPDRPGEWTHALMDVGAIALPAPRATMRRLPGASVVSPRLARADATIGRAAAPRATPDPDRFASTNRWLRGRILDRLRAAPDGDWVAFDGAIGTHDLGQVRAAADAMAADGVLEIGSAEDPAATLRARLPLA